jgi:Flp pilus assembly protein TadG
MIRPRSGSRQIREGATVVECAVVFPVFFLILIGTIVASLGVFRYQEMAALAREGARWASVHGQAYEFYTSQKAATEKDVYENVIRPKATGLDLDRLTYEVTWEPDNRQGSRVVVRVGYDWIPEAFLGGIHLSSTSSALMSY